MKKMHVFLILLLPIMCFGQSDTPFIEYNVKESSFDYFILVLSGDGGWHRGDQEFAGYFYEHGVSTLGWDVRMYFDEKKPRSSSRAICRRRF